MENDPADEVSNLFIKVFKTIYNDILDSNGNRTYPRNRYGDEFYLKFYGEDVILQTDDGLRYAKDASHNEIYPKDVHGNDKYIGSTYAITQFGPKYPKNKDEDEFYLKQHDGDVILQTQDGLQYAKDASHNEIYPKDAHGNDKYIDSTYAITAFGVPILPKTKDEDEFYLKNSDGSSIVIIDDKPLSRYAKKKNGDEIYPTQYFEASQSFREVILENQYAKLFNNRILYPLDAYGNEYTIAIGTYELDARGREIIDEEISFPNGYPITNDNYVIVPNVENDPYFLRNSTPTVENENILGKLYREANGYQDYLTNTKATKNSRSPAKGYIYFPTNQTMPVKRVPESLLNWFIQSLFVISIMMILFLGYALLKK
ncbi:hypothetical protein AVEN_261811-1 [Araneus ventricosus]|uniref:Uncharacterized protein n=1 Tax=Araneus ventricosus TaxID=182803 RepID=A0A4Y2LZ08_ARAVE|nr:hypothetical protein AVEN_261811-1 [Araneus ventricosus]